MTAHQHPSSNRGPVLLRLAQASGVGQSTIAQIKSGAALEPAPCTLGKLARALDTSPAALLEGYFNAIKTLAQVRKLQANTPGVQFNTQINL